MIWSVAELGNVFVIEEDEGKGRVTVRIDRSCIESIEEVVDGGCWIVMYSGIRYHVFLAYDKARDRIFPKEEQV